MYFNWTYAISSPVLFVEWKVNGSRIAIESVASSLPFAPVVAYVGRLSKIANAQVSLGPLTIADTGTYKAEVTYTNGNAGDSNQISLNVYGKTFFSHVLKGNITSDHQQKSLLLLCWLRLLLLGSSFRNFIRNFLF